MDTVAAIIDAKFAYARAIIQYDYYRLALNGPEAPPPVEEVLVDEQVEDNAEMVEDTTAEANWF